MTRPSRPVLVLGSSGRIGGLVAVALEARGRAVRRVSRRAGDGSVRFDWDDPATFAPALDGVGAVFVVGPTDHVRPLERTAPFLELVAGLDLDRVVLLTASLIPVGAPGLGEVDAALRALGVPWNTVRPSWFAQNFVDPAHAVGSAVLAGRDVVTATGSGRVGFVDAVDIAEVAAAALTGDAPADVEFVVTGPAAQSYSEAIDEIAALTRLPIVHRAVTPAARIASYEASGLNPGLAHLLTDMDVAIAGGAEDRVTDAVPSVLGRPATPLVDVVRRDLPAVAPELAAPPLPAEAPLVDVYRRHLAAATQGDEAGLRDVWEQDGVLEFPYAASAGTPGRLDGLDAITAYFAGGAEVFDDWSFGPVHTWRAAGADEYVIEVDGAAVLLPDRRPYRQHYIVRFGLSERGRLAWMREFWDPTAMR